MRIMIKHSRKICKLLLIISIVFIFCTIIVLTACPEKIYITVSYNPKGGTPVPQSVVVALGGEYHLPLVTKAGYTFLGWATGDNGTGDLLNAQSTVDIESSHTLYARWVPIQYTITYQLDGGENSQLNPATYSIETPTINLAEPNKPGNTFVGWYADAQYANASSSIPLGSMGNKIFHAKFGGPQYTVTFNPEGGTVNPTQKVVISGELYGELPVPEKNWHEFLGWYFGLNGTGGRIGYDVRVDITNDTEVHAAWKQVTYTVVFDKQGGNGGTDSVTATIGSQMPSATPPVKPGYEFDGYYVNSGGVGNQYYSPSMASLRTWDNEWWNSDEHRLYAYWKIPATVGTTGPGGGLIFYDNMAIVTEESGEQWRYMEAAPKETEWSSVIVGYYKDSAAGEAKLIGAGGTAVGSGKTNTDLTVSAMPNGTYDAAANTANLVQHYAAERCAQLAYGGKDDWYLPSKDELDWIYKQLYEKSLGGFSKNNYWSSSEYSASSVWYQRFGSYGEQSTQLGRGWDMYVRAVRRFKEF
jgi:uncharacterized repeat protein (TIGR02543 family)